jgi:hypothetical protein
VWITVRVRPISAGQRVLTVRYVSSCPPCSCLSWDTLGPLAAHWRAAICGTHGSWHDMITAHDAIGAATTVFNTVVAREQPCSVRRSTPGTRPATVLLKDTVAQFPNQSPIPSNSSSTICCFLRASIFAGIGTLTPL